MEGVRNARTNRPKQQPNESESEKAVDTTPTRELVSDTQRQVHTGNRWGTVSVEASGMVSDGTSTQVGQPDQRTDATEQSVGVAGTSPETGVELATQQGEEMGTIDGTGVSGSGNTRDSSPGSNRPSENVIVRREDGSRGDDVSSQTAEISRPPATVIHRRRCYPRRYTGQK